MANLHQEEDETLIKLVSESFVKPKHEVEAAKQPYHLGPVDLVMLTIDPIQKGLLFTLNNNTTAPTSSSSQQSRTHIVSHLLERLKHSLSIALCYFYPLAGRFTTQKHVEEKSCSIYVDCNKGLGARLIHATALGLTVSDIISPIDVTVARFFFDLGEKSINYDGHTRALLSIQVTELVDGVFIRFSMSHSVVDGTSFDHFINMLSEIFKSDYCASESRTLPFPRISRVPVFNYRPWLSYDPSNEDVPAIKLPFVDVDKFISRDYNPGPIRERMFHFSSASMAKLKAKANRECGTHNVISSFQALSALVWRSITRARNLPLDQQTTCFFAMGIRGRLHPPISDDYFGNFITRAQWACSVEELLGHDLGWAAMKLRQLFISQDGKELDFLKEYVNSPIMIPRGVDLDMHGLNSVIIGGSARFDMYGPEFGLGRALTARMGYGNKEDGKVTANPGCEGGGSVDLEICLKPHFMASLEVDHEFMSFVSSS